MKIKDFRVTPLFCRFKQPYFWAQGRHDGAHIALVHIETEEGILGLGETPATMMPIHPILSFLNTVKPLLIGQSICDISHLIREIYTRSFGIETASHSSPRIANQIFAGVELALWDALGKTVNLPVYDILGGKIHKEISYFGFIQGDTVDELSSHAKELSDDGFEVLYLKVGRGEDFDFQATKAVRESIGGKRLRVDPNEAWSSLQAENMIRKLSQFDLEMVEQPISALSGVNGLKSLKTNCSIPLAADQSVFTPEEAETMCSSGAVNLVTVGLHETGGILGFKKVASIAEVFGIDICLHGVFETGITTCASLQAASTIPNLDDGNQIMFQLLEEDLVLKPDLRPNSGKIKVLTGPGLGFELNEDAVKRATDAYKNLPR
ncbi:MAG: mandelate racemase/muconate lactonizing enzyme family protein [Paracoccaceae bacterium]|nr:mandelate racemase/muconate lactonizing enzyme family protein [Paracoccaceae bacterium]